MTIFRHKKSRKLYVLCLVSPPTYTGEWYAAYPYKWAGKILDNVKIENFEAIADYRGVL